MRRKIPLYLWLIFLLTIVSGASFALTAPSPVAAQTATLGSWQTTPTFPGRGHQYPSFAWNGYYYVNTTNNRQVYFARPNADGSITTWQLAWNDHGGDHGFTAVIVDGIPFMFRNGHIAEYPMQSDGTMAATDYIFHEPAGNLEYAYGGRLWVWDSVVYAPLSTGKFVYDLGGFSCPVKTCTSFKYTYNGDIFYSSVPIGDKFTFTGKSHPDYSPGLSQSGGIGKSIFYLPNGNANYGFIYTTRNMNSRLWRIRVNSDGSLGNWVRVTDLPAGTGNNRGDLFVINNTLFAIRGSKVWSSDLNATTGDLLGWTDSPPDLPKEQVAVHWGGELEGASYGIIGNYVYVTGDTEVYYSQIGGVVLPTATPTPTGQLPTATPTTGSGPTNTPTPTLSGPTNTPVPPACTPGMCTEALKQAGDYNCNCIIDQPEVNTGDYMTWLNDYITNAWSISLRYFEYWRRAFFSGGGTIPTPTPTPLSCPVSFQWDSSRGGIVRTTSPADPTSDYLGLFWTAAAGATPPYHVIITAVSDGSVYFDGPAPGGGIQFETSTLSPTETYNILIQATGTCAVLTGTSVPISTATPTPTPPTGSTPMPTIDPAVACNGLGNIGGTYGDIAVTANPDNRRADIHADKNLSVRGWIPTTASLGLVDLSGPVDLKQPPQLYRLFGDNRTPQFTNNYKVYDWDWNVQPDGARGAPSSLYDSTLVGMSVTRGERIFVPDAGPGSAYQLSGGYEVVVHYVDQDSISMHYREQDTVAGNGYTIHVDGVCIDQNLIAKYNSLGGNNGTRTRLPALRAGQAFGEAGGNEIRAAVADTGEFQDPRSRKDWWQLR